MNHGLTESTIDTLVHLISQNPAVNSIILYGSRAKGTYRPGSDIDITVKGSIDFGDILKWKSQIEDLLIPYTVDLSDFNTIENKELIDHIERAGILLYSN